MFISKLAIPRRTFLRGLGATVALPMLDAMVPAMSAAPTSTPRFSFIYIANGVIQDQWTPKATGADFELTPILRRSPRTKPTSTSSAASRICKPIRSATARATIRVPRRRG